jgi:hypothetical protein
LFRPVTRSVMKSGEDTTDCAQQAGAERAAVNNTSAAIAPRLPIRFLLVIFESLIYRDTSMNHDVQCVQTQETA